MTTPSGAAYRVGSGKTARWRSEGRRRLAVYASGAGSHASIARLLGIAWQRISQFLSGQRMPHALAITRIQDVCGIPADTWGRAPQENATNVAGAAGEGEPMMPITDEPQVAE